uniref:Putative ixodes 8-cys protein n=1 Tax=Ixodes ricinus TaxID=34613 RepID=A0A0K8RKJ6_IXORI
MARLACAFLAFVLAYQCADVVNGAVQENNIPGFVGSRSTLLEHLKQLCKKNHNSRVIARLDLANCEVTCANGAFQGIFGSPPTVSLKDRERCDSTGGICVKGVCAHKS